MKAATKIELYDAGAVLYCTPDDFQYEYTGLDYSDGYEFYQLEFFGLEILKKSGVLADLRQVEEIFRDTDNMNIFSKKLHREVFCSELAADELSNGNLRISAVAEANYLDIRTQEGKEWPINMVYRGNYSVFWRDE